MPRFFPMVMIQSRINLMMIDAHQALGAEPNILKKWKNNAIMNYWINLREASI